MIMRIRKQVVNDLDLFLFRPIERGQIGQNLEFEPRRAVQKSANLDDSVLIDGQIGL